MALVGEEVLLGEACEGAEMSAAELGNLGGFPANEAIAAFHGSQDPNVDRKCFEPTSAEKECAISDFFADAG
jgi:hypothetical protein